MRHWISGITLGACCVGGVPEWLIGTVLKTVDWLRQSVGSNPTPSARSPRTCACLTAAATARGRKRLDRSAAAAGVAKWQTLRT